MALRPTLDLLAASPSRRLLLAVALPTVVALGSAALLVSSPSACAQPVPAAADAELIAAFKRFQQAGPNDHAAIDDAAERFAHLSAAHPTDPVLRAYAGASTSMRATTTLLPWRKMSYAEDGLALIDKALAQLTPAHDAALHRGVPAVLETRFVAVGTFLALPAMFNRNERGRKLLDQVLGSPLFGDSPLPFRAAVWLRAAQLSETDKQPAQARRWYELVAGSNAPQADLARSKLKAL